MLLSYYCVIHLKYVYFKYLYINVFACFLNVFYNTKSKIYFKNFKQYLNEHKNHFQNVDKTKFNITSV